MYVNQLQIIIRILEHNFAKETDEEISKYSAVSTRESSGEESDSHQLLAGQSLPGGGKETSWQAH